MFILDLLIKMYLRVYHDVIGCEEVCGDRLHKQRGCKVNDRQWVTVSC